METGPEGTYNHFGAVIRWSHWLIQCLHIHKSYPSGVWQAARHRYVARRVPYRCGTHDHQQSAPSNAEARAGLRTLLAMQRQLRVYGAPPAVLMQHRRPQNLLI